MGDNFGCCDQCGPVLVTAASVGTATITTHDGKETMVIPVTAIVEGVLNNALVTASEFGKFISAWEGVPVPVSHPQVNGMHVSSNLPDILEKFVIGRFHNVTVKTNKLVGELWIDTQSAIKKGFQNIIDALKSNRVLEVSTAYYADTDPQAGIHNGKKYTGIHKNLRPDHLAILPDEIGACSVADGCGTFRNTQQKPEETTMEKRQIVDAIIAQSSVFTAQDDSRLMALDDDVLTGLIKANNTETVEAEADTETVEANAVQLSESDQLALNWARKQYANHQSKLISKLLANSSCKFGKDDLHTMSVDQLEKLDASLTVVSGDFSGRGMPVTHTAGTQETPLDLPLVVLAKNEDGK